MKDRMTVAELIEKLKEFPQDLPVAAIDGVESVGWVKTITIEDPKEPYYEVIWSVGKEERIPYLFIKGY